MADQKTQTVTKDESSKQAASRATAASKRQDQLDEQEKQTFPASDPPAGWAGKDIAPQDRKGSQKS